MQTSRFTEVAGLALGIVGIIIGIYAIVLTLRLETAYKEIEKLLNREAAQTQELAKLHEWNNRMFLNSKGYKGTAFKGRLPDNVLLIAAQEAMKQEIDPALIQAIIAQESGGNQKAKSKVGAQGLMQLMPKTAKAMKVDISCPRQNVKGGVAYFKQLLKRYDNNVYHALAAYNWGPGNFDAWLKTGKGARGQEMPIETRRYVPGVLNRIALYNYDL